MTDLTTHFRAIKRVYENALPEWMDDYEATGRMAHDPYLMDWKFTPIEHNVWCDIRHFGLPFYPQLPALNYFLDFGNPFLKIGIECDGKAWHDKEADKRRDARLAAAGWMIYRLEGHECCREVDIEREFQDDEPPSIEELVRHYGSTSAGILKAIRARHFRDDPHCDQILMDVTLFNHRSTPDNGMQRRPERRGNREPVRAGDMAMDYVLDLLERSIQ